MLRSRDERGIAMVTALMVTMVVLTLSVAVVALSIHNTGQSAEDRKRVQAVAAAEAGIDAYFSALQTSTGTSTCSPLDADLPTTPAAHYHVDITLYSTWPPTDTSVLPCPPTTDPLGARVVSKGTAVATTSTVAVNRTMQSEVRMVPIYGGFNKAIFSDTQLNFQNKFTLNGNLGNDGDVYTNGNFALGNNTTIFGSVYAQGSASIAQGIVKADVWARNAVDLSSGIEVFGNGTSSTSSITMSNNSTIDGNAKAGTTISGGTVKGTKTQNSPSGPPPQVALPQITYNQQAWIDAGYTINNYSSCALAKIAITAGLVGDNVIRITPTCALSWGNNSTITVKGNLAIITDGSFATTNQTNWDSTGSLYTMYVINPYVAGRNCTKPSPYDYSVSNNTNFNNVQTFFYSQCNIDFGNNNAGGVPAQIIGGTVTITNQMTMKYSPILVPGFNLTGYNVQISYIREVTNS
jgi:Tfp pilus assembly protein PilX/cytoskeletal protein CcmA (bactofilin family)